MKHDAINHLKLKKLKRALGIPLYQAVGILECLWNFTTSSAWDGAIGRFTNEELAIELEWEGDPDTLIQALVGCGWLDVCEERRLVIHDWSEHAPEFIKKRLQRRGTETHEKGEYSVYFLHAPDCQKVKIGKSVGTEGRIRAIAAMSPVAVELLVVIPSALHSEAELHRRFKSHRLHGEWFAAVPELMEFIDSLTQM